MVLVDWFRHAGFRLPLEKAKLLYEAMTGNSQLKCADIRRATFDKFLSDNPLELCD